MGEMADMALDETMDMEDLRLDYRTGCMDISEAYDLGIINELGSYEAPGMFSPAVITGGRYRTCKHCKMGGLEWKKFGASWRLVDSSGHAHTCNNYTKDE